MKLLEPLQVGSRILRNRVVVTSHTTCYVDADHHPDERDVAYFAARAAGGAALLTTGTVTVHRSSPLPYGVYANFDESIVEPYRRLTEAVHAEGALIIPQLGHMAQRAYDEPLATWSPGSASYHTRGTASHAMSGDEVRELVEAFAAAAERSIRGGMDGVELACGHGQLINLFLSPLTNDRTDEYGGDACGRLRFAHETLLAVRAAMGPEPLLGIRVNGDDEVTGSLDADDWREISVALVASGVVDYVSVSANFHESVVPTMHDDHGLYVPWAAALKQLVDVPVVCVGRIVDPGHAEEIVAGGRADAVGMTRAHIADPDIVRKLVDGRPDDIRPCVGCVQTCIGNVQQGRPITCVFNPQTGSESIRRTAEVAVDRPARVVVVGGGPGGMEAARVAGLQGDRVVLLERAGALGGAARRYAAAVPARAEFARGLDWSERQLRRHGVDVRLGVDASAETVMELEPDRVIVATGARDFLPAWTEDVANAVGVRRAMEDPDVRGRVVVVDGDHRGQALFIATILLDRGCEVTVASVEPTIGGFVERGTRDATLRACGERVRFLNLERWVGIDAEDALPRVVLEHVATLRISRVEADWIVGTGAASCDALVGALTDRVHTVAIGDALAPRRIESAVHDAAAVLANRQQPGPIAAAGRGSDGARRLAGWRT